MEDEQKLHRCVTKFMLDTCRYSKTNNRCFLICNNLLANFGDNYETFSSGSSAEFYIEPMLPCVGDTDIMVSENDRLATPAESTPPTELPDNFQQSIIVYAIIDSHQSGYVYLKPSYNLIKNDEGRFVVENMKQSEDVPEVLPKRDNEDYNNPQTQQYVQFLKRYYLRQDIQSQPLPQELNYIHTHLHGAAYTYTSRLQQSALDLLQTPTTSAAFRHYMSLTNVDIVSYIRCLQWPPQAADWPTRLRNHSVPNQITIDTVISNGCDVVEAVHPLCKQDEWMNRHQWRLSFSRAEVTLLNSWTPVQQIIYHMLRYVLKRKGLSKTDDKEQNLPKLSNYHIKTLMLWECEQKPQSWWSAESSLIKLCSSLLHKLSDWVENKHWQHYFISTCNILDYLLDVSPMIFDDLRCLADSSSLLTWFINNYIRECAQSYPDNLPALFKDISSTETLVKAVQTVSDFKFNILPREKHNMEHKFPEMYTLFELQVLRIDAACIEMRLRRQQKLDPHLGDYFVALLSLHIAYVATISSLTVDHLETLWLLFNPFNASSTEFGELSSIRKAIELATLSTVRSNSLEMLHNEMSKAYLHHSFVYGQESTYGMVHVLLAALYYKSGHYQAAIDHCKQLLNQHDREQCGLRCIGAEYLPQIDEDVDAVDAVFGLVLLYQHFQKNTLKCDEMAEPDCKRPFAFTASLLARYLYSKCSSAVTAQSSEVQMYRKQLSDTKHLLVGDVLLYKTIEMDECAVTAGDDRKGNDSSRAMDTSLLVTMLEQVALEKLIAFRQLMVHELHCKQFPVANEFDVLYAYRCGLFEECMELCRLDIAMLLGSGCLNGQSYAAHYPEMLSLLDGELVSVYGIIRILRPNWLFNLSTLFDSRHYHEINTLTLFLYLLARCQINLRSESLLSTMTLICHVHNQVFSADNSFDRLILRLIYRLLRLHIRAATDE